MFGVRQLPAAQGCSQPAETTLTHFHSMRCEGLSRLHACGNVPSVEPERENAPSQKAVARGAQGSEEPACASVSAGTVPLCAPPQARLFGARQCVRVSWRASGPFPRSGPAATSHQGARASLLCECGAERQPVT